MNHRPLWIVLWLAALLWFGALWLSGHGIALSGLGLFLEIPGIILIVVALFDGWVWRWPVVRQFISRRPDARGTWRGRLINTWKQPDGTVLPPIMAYLVIRQTYFSIWARMMTEQSASETISANLIQAADGVGTLAAVYRNEPRINLRATSPMHLGAFVVELQGDPVTRLEGHYWTDRETAGQMEFSERNNKLAPGFQQAANLAYAN